MGSGIERINDAEEGQFNGIAFSDADFAELFPRRGQPAFAPWRLALITVILKNVFVEKFFGTGKFKSNIFEKLRE